MGGTQQWQAVNEEPPLTPEGARELDRADCAYQEPARAEAHLRRALAIAPEHMEVWVALYRFYFYSGDLEQASVWAERCIERTARELGLPLDWRDVEARGRDYSAFDAVKPRFFLFALKAWGYVQLRLGNVTQGRDAAMKLLELDPRDRVGAGLLIEVLDRSGADDD
jgi:tetratricopeptide (TPR) repeat protein